MYKDVTIVERMKLLWQSQDDWHLVSDSLLNTAHSVIRMLGGGSRINTLYSRHLRVPITLSILISVSFIAAWFCKGTEMRLSRNCVPLSNLPELWKRKAFESLVHPASSLLLQQLSSILVYTIVCPRSWQYLPPCVLVTVNWCLFGLLINGFYSNKKDTLKT